MAGTGNDIVALKAIDTARTIQPNFYFKIIIAAEKGLYDHTLSGKMPFEHFVWLAWSVKESVYKFLQRQNPDLVFSPSRIIIQQLNIREQDSLVEGNVEGVNFDRAAYAALVMFGDRQLYSRSILNSKIILSVVNDSDDFSGIYWGIKITDSCQPDAQSASVRAFVLNKLKSLFPGEKLRIEKSPHGYPTVFKNDAELPVVVSFAHHDHWLGYSFVVL